MALTPVTVIFDLEDGSGNPVTQGIGYCIPSAVLTDTTDNLTIPQKPIPINFYPNGFPTAVLFATDSSNLTPAFTWQAVFKGDGLPGAGKTFHLLTAGGAQQYYSHLS